MSEIQLPKTLLRIARYDDNVVGELVKFNPNFMIGISPLEANTQWIHFEEKSPIYLAIVSKAKTIDTRVDYNIQLTITSYSEERNLEVLKEMTSKVKIPFRISSPEHEQWVQQTGILFTVLNYNRKRMLDELDNLRKNYPAR